MQQAVFLYVTLRFNFIGGAGVASSSGVYCCVVCEKVDFARRRVRIKALVGHLWSLSGDGQMSLIMVSLLDLELVSLLFYFFRWSADLFVSIDPPFQLCVLIAFALHL